MQPLPKSPPINERSIVFLVGAVQFINILDFMMVMPLGPDFSRALGISTSHLGLIGGSYTAAAALSGLLGGFFLDRYDRRKALAVAMLGLVIGTASGALATGLSTLMAARVLAGLFGGPATSLSFSIIADVFPPERRGKALGAVMGSFAVASVLGVPTGLWLAQHGGWQVPFLGVAGLGLLITGAAVFLLPPMRLHLEGRSDPGVASPIAPAGTTASIALGSEPAAARGAPPIATTTIEHPTFASILGRPLVLWSYLLTATVMMSGFILIPNISAFVQFNLGYPRERLGLPYLAGGVVSFGTTRLVGYLVDRYGSFRVGTAGSIMLAGVVYVGFYHLIGIPVVSLFIGFMLSMGFRNVSYNTLTSRVPSPRERARFMSIQSSVQHLASALGAFLSSQMLRELPDHSLAGIENVSLVTIALSLATPLLLWHIERSIQATPTRAPAPQAQT